MTQQVTEIFTQNRTLLLILVCAIGLGFSSHSLYAEIDDNIEETLVTATRTEKAQNDIVVGTIVITRAKIESMGANDLADILRFEAGLDIGRNGGPGQTTSVFIRGTESNHSLVLIDGVEMNPGTIGGAAIQNIAPAMIERIEIIKGPRSSLYGSEAIGGVINIITRKSEKTSINTQMTYGSHDHKQITAHSAFREEDRFASFTLDWKDTDGFASLREQTEDRGHDNLSLNLRAGLNLFDQALEFTHFQASGNTEYYGFDTLAFDTGPLDQNFENSVTSLSIDSDLSPNWHSKVLLGQAKDNIEQNQLDFFFFPEPQKDRVKSRRFSLDWQNTYALTNHQLIAGAYFEREKARSQSFGSEYADATESKAIYLASDSQLGKLNTLVAARYTDHETAGNQTSWNIDIGYELTPKLKAGITSGQAFRAPDATDRYGFGGNPNLKTEESSSISAMLNWQSPFGDLNAEVFQTNIDNLIEYFITDFTSFVGENRNIAETKIKGLELSHKINWYDWSIQTTALVQSPKDTQTNSDLLRRARRSLSTQVNKEFNNINLGFQLLATSKRTDIDAVTFNQIDTSGYVLANLTGSYNINDNLSIFAKMDNLLDTEYETAAGYMQANRNYQLSLRLKY